MRERQLIELIARRCGPPRDRRVLRGIGDDAAVVAAKPVCVVSTDSLVEDVHFTLSHYTPAEIGHKALATALSDLAAMGAEVGEAYLALALPGRLREEFSRELIDGVVDLAENHGVTIAGGDVVDSSALALTVTVVGWAENPERLVYRDGARQGQRVGVTGTLGAAGAALLLESYDHEPPIPLAADQRRALEQRLKRPRPRLREGLLLAESGASAMIDLSDGLASDARQLAQRSGVRLHIDLAALPLAAGVREVAAARGLAAEELAATAGEDYELLFTVDDRRVAEVEQALAAADCPVTWVGAVEVGTGVVFFDASGHCRCDLHGFEHGRVAAKPERD